tara:strand:- start:240 stop:446 length:207 start_codon:yes stop_codon:yes gene_type:complete
MSYVDTLSEADEVRAHEEGRLQGLKDAVRLTRDMKKNVCQLLDRFEELHKQAIEAQQQFLHEVYGDEE